jgi:hypothetical protein
VGALESVALTKAELRTSWLYQMTHAINTMPSLYLEAGAIQAACCARKAGRSATPKTSAATTRSTRLRGGSIATASILSLSQTLSCLAVDRESDDDRAQ